MLTGLIGLACGCTTVPQLSHRAVLTPAEQAGIGAVAVSELLGTSPLSQDQQQAAVTSAVGQRLAYASGRGDINWDFKVVQHDRPCAVALPDGTVLITDSLLARCHSEAELAAALAKEMGYMLAGVYPREVVAPPEAETYVPLNLGQLTPADQSTARSDDIQAADSIGLSLLVTAGYDPSAAMVAWMPAADPTAAIGRRAATNAHRRSAGHEQSFTKSLTQARTIYQSHSAKLGNGQALAFTAVRPQHDVAQAAAVEWDNPAPFGTATVSSQAVPTPTSSGGNVAEFTSDGEFLPPRLDAGHPGDSHWSSAAGTTAVGEGTGVSPRAVQQTSYEQFDAPAAGPALP
ncbi:MAG: M48 family metalloprotease [Planctomycetaceae bacterium]|nr:M48 family metalloprotease [Planctomycetaceae bacterium]